MLGRHPPAVQVQCPGPGQWRRIDSTIRSAAAACVGVWSGAWLGWPWMAVVPAAGLAALAAWAVGSRSARGAGSPVALRWDGRAWTIAAGPERREIALESVHVAIDTGRALLVRAAGPDVPAALRWWWIGAGGPRGVPEAEFRDLCTALYAQRSGVVPPEPRW